MSEQDSYKEMAVADFTIKLVAGVIIGAIAFVLGLVFLIITLVTGKNYDIIGVPIAFIGVGALVSAINIVVLSKKNKSKKEKVNNQK